MMIWSTLGMRGLMDNGRAAEIDKFCQELGEVWHQVPDLRFGQLIANALSSCGKDIFYVEDDEMINRLEEFSTL